MSQMVFVPMTWDDAVALRSGTQSNQYQACAATEGLIASLEPDALVEEAEYAALCNAGVLALVIKPAAPRLILAAEVKPDQLNDLGRRLGEVEIRGLTWTQVRALFADEPDAREAVRAASEAVKGESLAAAVDAPEVGTVLDGYDLLWFAPEELDELVGH